MDVSKYWKNLVNWVRTNPDAATALGTFGPILVKLAKDGTLAKIGSTFITNVKLGMPVKQALQAAITGPAVKTGVAKAGKVAAVAAACAVAFGTIKEAVKGGKAAINEKEPGWKKIVDFAWNTSIPGATVNQIRAFGKWLTHDPKKDGSNNDKKEDSPKHDDKDLKPMPKQESLTDEQLNDEARSLGMMDVPKNSQARDQWMREYERRKNMGKGNHPIWYGKKKGLVTANLNYGVIKQAEEGYDIAVGSKIVTMITPPMKDGKVAQSYKDQIDALYIKMRGSNSGAFNYDEEDVAAYLECVRGIRSFFKTLQRDIKLVRESKVYESDTPDTYLEVAGYDAAGRADMKSNRALYISELNIIADTLETRFPIPPNMSVFDRSDYVSDTILKESDSVKACWYIYTVDFVYSPTGTNQQLTLVPTPNATSFGSRLAILRTLIDNMALYNNPNYNVKTFSKIAGDLIKAYGTTALKHYVSVSDRDKVEIIFDEYLLHQLQTTNSGQLGTSNWAVTMINNIYDSVISCDIVVPGNSAHVLPVTKIPGFIDSSGKCEDIIVNTNKNKVDELETLSLTRGVALFKVNALSIAYGATTGATVTDCGTDIILGIATYYYSTNGTIQRFGMFHRGHSVFPEEEIELWTQVDYFPLVNIYDDGADVGGSNKLFDIDNYAFMSRRQYQNFNDICIKSLYTTVDIDEQANFKDVPNKVKK